MSRLLVLFFVLLASGGGVRAASGSTAPTHQASSTARASDAEIEQKIRMKLAKSKIGKDGFVPKVHGGVVTWEGRTAIPQHKGAATRMAKTAGAVRVINNIQISDGAKPGQPVRHAQVKPGQESED